MTWVVDASVALKWVLEESDAEVAQDVLDLDGLAAPDFLLLECANILTRQVQRRQMSPDDAIDRLRFIERAVPRFIPMRPYLEEAQRLSLLLRHPAYDCLYVAIALSESGTLITADEELADLAEPLYPMAIHRLRLGAPRN